MVRPLKGKPRRFKSRLPASNRLTFERSSGGRVRVRIQSAGLVPSPAAASSASIFLRSSVAFTTLGYLSPNPEALYLSSVSTSRSLSRRFLSRGVSTGRCLALVRPIGSPSIEVAASPPDLPGVPSPFVTFPGLAIGSWLIPSFPFGDEWVDLIRATTAHPRRTIPSIAVAFRMGVLIFLPSRKLSKPGLR